MSRMDDINRSFRSARSGRVRKDLYAPPFIIYAVFGISIIIQIPVGYLIHHFSFTLGMLLNQIGTLLLPVYFVVRFFGLTTKAVLPFKGVKQVQVVLSIVMIIALAVLTDYLLYLTEWALPISESLEEKYNQIMHVDGVGSYIYKFGLLCLLPSVCEEIYFRGFCQTGLVHHYGKWPGIVITALLFAIAHLSPWYFHLYFILGIFLSWLFVTSKTLWIPIICHIVNNFWTFTAHTLDLKLPIQEGQVWMNIPIVAIAILVFLGSLYLWNNSTNTATYKIPRR